MIADRNPQPDRRSVSCAPIGQRQLRPGDRVRLKPNARADILDLVLSGQVARIESIEQDFEQRLYLAVTIDEDPGQDLGALHQPGHRFFFDPSEVESLEPAELP